MKVSCVIRFHDITYIEYLERALHSLHSQVDVSVKPIIVLQRFTIEEREVINSLLERNWYFPTHQEPSVINFEDEFPVDARSKLMNIGIQCHIESDNSFLAFLDYDDFLYSNAYKLLGETLEQKSTVAAFATVELAKVVPLVGHDFMFDMTKPFKGRNKLDLLRDNFCPIHSYMINTDLLDRDSLFFRENMTRVEDYEFLIRTIGNKPCDFSNLDTSIGCYVMRSDGTNTTPARDGSDEDTDKVSVWAQNVKLLNKYKSETEVTFFASDF